ncbi:MAG: hybrid sensor histidine kinase/response regulator [SAR324 cluster bacterium]|nr:hybrid sensor histidine kinase/response regulator [SAR324 cluster bacterium]
MNNKTGNIEQEAEPRGNVLVVDDNPNNLRLLSGILTANGYKARSAPSASLAFRSAKASLPDLILLDIMMPDIDGFEACRQFKDSPEAQDIPIIFLTAKMEMDDMIKGFELGAVDYITKPFNSRELLTRINTHLQLKRNKEVVLKQKTEYQELLHVLCHDLLNPLNGLMLALQHAKEDPSILVEKRSMMLHAVQSGVKIVDLVRQMRALEEKKYQMTLIPVNLKEVISHSINMLQDQFIRKEITPVINVDETLMVQVEETSFINSVINNILTNAIKFSFSGSSIMIDAEGKENRIILVVKDTGVGMSEKLLQDIFKPNKATTRSGTNGEKGTGFGMPLMKKFVVEYGGSIEVFSQQHTEDAKEHGTQVVLTLAAGSGDTSRSDDRIH